MQTEIEQFVWHCAENGYRWMEMEPVPNRWVSGEPVDVPEDKRFLVEVPMKPPRYLRFNPFKAYPLLYREFGHLERSEHAFAAFASTYGPLGASNVSVVQDGTLIQADPLSAWFESRYKIREVVDVLDAIQAEDTNLLGTWFRFEKDRIKYERRDEMFTSFGVIAGAGFGREWLVEWAGEPQSQRESLVRAARGWAQTRINSALSGSGPGQNRYASTTARVLFNLERRDLSLHFVPSNLLAAMWLQCARVLVENPQFRSCDHCGKWFELSPESRRKHAKYCSDKCKVAAYRKRKQSHGKD